MTMRSLFLLILLIPQRLLKLIPLYPPQTLPLSPAFMYQPLPIRQKEIQARRQEGSPSHWRTTREVPH
jgi:hypothetical protein